MKLKATTAILLACVLALPSFAADDTKEAKKKPKQPRGTITDQLLKRLEAAELTKEQVATIKEKGAKIFEELKAARKAAGITPELQKKLGAAQRAHKDSKLKGKERIAAIHKEVGVTEEQAKALTKANQIRAAFQKDVIAMLTDEQRAKLKRLGKGQAKGKGKKKKEDSEKSDS